MTLTPELAARFADLTLGHVTREYPHKLDHVMTGPGDVLAPSVLHPIFYGSFDWHSCVHGWWQLLTIARLFPDLPQSARIRALADTMITTEKVTVELAYVERSASAGFERPYGWGWLLALHGEAVRHDAGWADALEPLARAFAERFAEFLPRLTYPIRVGAHGNSAFAMVLAYDWAVVHDRALALLIASRAQDWFGEDRDCQAWEPAGDEFLSPALVVTLLMSRTTSGFAMWFDDFLPCIASGRPASLVTPATVSDRTDGKIVHLDGLNLSRAWCWRAIAQALGPAHPVSAIATEAAERHISVSLPHVAGDYMGEHWLASFALLALV